MRDIDPVSRRGFLLLGGGLLLATAGCTGSPDAGPSAGSTGTTSPVRPSTAPPSGTASSPEPSTSTPAFPTPDPWRPSSGDVDPDAKRAAVQVVAAIGTWQGARGGQLAAASRRLADLGASAALAAQAPALLPRDTAAAAVQVIEAQNGGILPGSASVLVVCRQWRAFPDGSITTGGTTVDVRLERAGSRWRVTALHPARPGPPLPSPSLPARRVIANRRIELPPAGWADVASGNVYDSVLTAMLQLAATYRIGVSVVRSGHPRYVFGTTRLSDHPQGRAFDTFRINGRLVVDPATPKRVVTGYMESAARAGSYNVGGPYLLAGSGSQFFSDATHHDHVHAGFVG